MQEREIKGYEGRYTVTDDGRVFSLMNSSFKRRTIEKKQGIDKDGYPYVMLYKDGKRKHMTVHRLVASAFLENDDDLPQVNHKDGNKQNNTVENLEWCTASHNVQHSYDIGLNVPHQSPWKNCKSGDHPKAKKVKAEKEGEVLTFSSSIDACIYLGVSKSGVAQAINRNHKCKGWKVSWMSN